MKSQPFGELPFTREPGLTEVSYQAVNRTTALIDGMLKQALRSPDLDNLTPEQVVSLIVKGINRAVEISEQEAINYIKDRRHEAKK